MDYTVEIDIDSDTLHTTTMDSCPGSAVDIEAHPDDLRDNRHHCLQNNPLETLLENLLDNPLETLLENLLDNPLENLLDNPLENLLDNPLEKPPETLQDPGIANGSVATGSVDST